LDQTCLDLSNQGNCIGSCQPKGFAGSTPGSNGVASVTIPPPSQAKGFPPPQQQAPYPQGPYPGPAPPPSPTPAGILGGIANLLGGKGPKPPQQQPPPQQPPRSGPPATAQTGGWLSGLPTLGGNVTPIPIRMCPSNMKCRGNDVCVPHPRPKPGSEYLCVNADTECGKTLLIFNKQCPAGMSCLANPKYDCDKSTGICQGNDGICVPPPQN